MSHAPHMERTHSYNPPMERRPSHYSEHPSSVHGTQPHDLAMTFSAAFAMPSAKSHSREQYLEAHPTRPEPRRAASYLDEKNTALAEFVDRTSHMASVVNIAAQIIPVAQLTTAKWLQLATFWLLKGRAGLDIYQSSLDCEDEDFANGLSPTQSAAMLTQPHLNIYKTWWIISEVLEVRLSETESAEFVNAGDSYRTAVFELTDALVVAFKDLALRVSCEGLLSGGLVLLPGLDSSLWMGEQSFPEDLTWLRRML